MAFTKEHARHVQRKVQTLDGLSQTMAQLARATSCAATSEWHAASCQLPAVAQSQDTEGCSSFTNNETYT